MSSIEERTILVDDHAEHLAYGSADDTSTRARREASRTTNQVVDEVRGLIGRQPLTALLAVASIGFLISFITVRR